MSLRCVSALLVCACLAWGSEPRSVDRTLPVSGPVVLDVRSDPGGVIISAGTSTSVRVHAVIKPLYGRVDLNVAEANIRALVKDPPIEQEGNRIRIGYVKDPSLLRAVTIRFEIETPRATEVQARTRSGRIRVDGISGPVAATTGSGRTEISNVASEIRVNGGSGAVTIRNAGARVFVRTQSGGVDLAGVRGAVEAETSSGRTEMTDVAGGVRSTTTSGSITALQIGGSVHAQTNSAAIRISQTNPAPIRAISGSGAIKVTLAAGGGYQLDAQSGSGKVFGPSSIASHRTPDGHTLKAQVGSGGPLVDLDTRSSRIDVD